eukprot:Protomagalhaensia_sp_Gyna_25__5606@NODE_777_length_2642_cov_159_905878_g610_i0_p1_GENE_NODE_777_length_2642_cov_159_905878_g610_i0NODE_777_length_2642_cov_159_905878_g610_i0_p1_ORF_typecomplete_len382_score11_93DMT_YdcZ/PF04657_13/1_6e10DMT_YdcZ/PF04657_13/9_5e197TMRDISM_7TM/PF07695_11/0_0167TMRDISM_7TM/PF07695_11/127TMRDISM_7TM/PF07695_11/1_5e03MCLC/PF05934_11/0_95MCLC/PF05934_11/5_4e02_NODE_777_length_2642_cov_159_905878_g610_i014432588
MIDIENARRGSLEATRIHISDTATEEPPSKTASIHIVEQATPTRPLWVKSVLYAMPFISGCLSPLQSALNRKAFDTSGNLFFTVGCIYVLSFLIVGIWAWWSNYKGATLRGNCLDVINYVSDKPVRCAILCTGLMGTFINLAMGLVAAGGGTGLYTLGALIGTLVVGLVFQVTGLFWTPRSWPHWLFYLGVLLSIGGGITYSLRQLTSPLLSTSQQLQMLGLSFLSGTCVCIQAGTSNELGRVLGEFRRALAYSFFSGLLIMFFVAPYAYPLDNVVEILKPRNWWQLTQAPLAVLGLCSVAVSQRIMPGPMVYCLLVLGQLLSATIFDHFGWIGLEVREITLDRVLGLVGMLAGVGFVTMGKLRMSAVSVAVDRKASRSHF